MKNILLLLLGMICILSCNKKEEVEEPIQYKISEDICVACAEDPFFIICNDTIIASDILTPNSDGKNDILSFYIMSFDSSTCILATELWIYNKNGIELAHYDDYLGGPNGWPQYNSNHNNQNTENLNNGLYKFKMSKGEEIKTGYFIIIIINFDEYLDMSFYKLPCVDDCFIFDPDDPILDYYLHEN